MTHSIETLLQDMAEAVREAACVESAVILSTNPITLATAAFTNLMNDIDAKELWDHVKHSSESSVDGDLCNEATEALAALRTMQTNQQGTVDEHAFQKALDFNRGQTYSDSETAFRDFLRVYESACTNRDACLSPTKGKNGSLSKSGGDERQASRLGEDQRQRLSLQIANILMNSYGVHDFKAPTAGDDILDFIEKHHAIAVRAP